MNTSSVNKLNRYRATLDAIAAKDFNENHGPDGRFASGSSGSSGTPEGRELAENLSESGMEWEADPDDNSAYCRVQSSEGEVSARVRGIGGSAFKRSYYEVKKTYADGFTASDRYDSFYAASESANGWLSRQARDAAAVKANDYNENHGPDGRFTEGSSSSGSAASAANKKLKSEIFKEATKRAGENKLNVKATESVNRIAYRDLKLDDLDSWGEDSYDVFTNESGSFDISKLREGLREAYKAGAANNQKSISAKEIERKAKRLANKALGVSMSEKGRDKFDLFENSRGSFDKFDISMAFEHAYGDGYSNGKSSK